MVKWNHIVERHTRDLLEGRIPLDQHNIEMSLTRMSLEQKRDAKLEILDESILYARADRLWDASRHYTERNFGLSLKAIEDFYKI